MTSGNTSRGGADPAATTSGNTRRSGRPRRPVALPQDLAGEREDFAAALARSTDLGAATRDKYLRNATHFLVWLAEAREAGALDGDPLADPDARDWAVRDYRRHLKNVRVSGKKRLSAATINNRLAAVESFFSLRGSGRPA